MFRSFLALVLHSFFSTILLIVCLIKYLIKIISQYFVHNWQFQIIAELMEFFLYLYRGGFGGQARKPYSSLAPILSLLPVSYHSRQSVSVQGHFTPNHSPPVTSTALSEAIVFTVAHKALQ